MERSVEYWNGVHFRHLLREIEYLINQIGNISGDLRERISERGGEEVRPCGETVS
jgi:hypothetical protein